MSDLFGNLDISISGMRAERQRMDVTLNNIANASTTRTPEGGPYRRQQVVFEAVLDGELNSNGAGVKVSAVLADAAPGLRVHQPGHPDADADGNVLYPNVNSAEEMVTLMASAHSYDANAAGFRIAREMMQRALDLLRT